MDAELSEIFEGASEKVYEASSAVTEMVTAGSAGSSSRAFFVEEPENRRGRVPGSRTVPRRPVCGTMATLPIYRDIARKSLGKCLEFWEVKRRNGD